ncbi:MAG: hypothetical protein K1X67_13870 [Fimbriimonadaceae bacterium]|nr:hypothetical protein [Fimbriimonadaceae bacterium]
MNIGDVLAVVAGALAICGSAWALLVISAVVFGTRTQHAQGAIERHPWRTLGIGLFGVVVFGTLSVIMAAQPLPLVKLVGTMMYLSLFAVAVVGGGGIAAMIGRRLQPMDSSMSPFQALTRGSGILVLAGLFPMLGWFVLAPLTLFMSLGAGIQALVAKPLAPPIYNEVI